MKIKQIEADLQLLKERVEKLSRIAYFGVVADEIECVNIFKEYNIIISDLKKLDVVLFESLIPIEMPPPEEADNLSIHESGIKVYYSKHFERLEDEVNKTLHLIQIS
jgi:hypothetical protein